MNVTAETRERFLQEYCYIRHAEGRGSCDSEYYRALPFADRSGRNTAMWEMRSRTYRHFEKKVLQPLEAMERRPLDILDLGAGNCWLSYRLAERGHRPLAVDVFSDEEDGLRAARHYPTAFPTLESDYDHIPLRSQKFDLAIFNASLHYSTNYIDTLSEVKRCLRAAGAVVILDSPIYRTREHGIRMVREKHADFMKRYGFASDALPSMEFLDLPMLRTLHETLGLDWQFFKPWYGYRWHLRPVNAWLHKRRPPSWFWILLGRFRVS